MLKIDMAGKAGLVIGGSCGIGAAVCSELLNNGCKMACTHLGTEKDDEGVASLGKFVSFLLKTYRHYLL